MPEKPVAVVTGAGRGIGAATALMLGRRGYHVVVNYLRDTGAATAVAAQIASASTARADVCDPGQVDALVDAVLAEHGRIDALVCNANVRQPILSDVETTSWDELIGKVGAELGGAFFITRRVLPVMRAAGSGRIVYLSSMAAGWTGKRQLTHAVSKAALNSFAQQVAAEAGRYGVSVNTVAPGAVRTEASAAFMAPEMGEHLAGHSVLGRMIEPDDVAAVIELLLDDRTGALTGALIPVDAGFDVIVGGPPRLP
ncbi:SDR family oxidoreductase [Winogradskya consettensis]|uniref:3-oxoacyl-ACP reductase n=1 Tax=Winogradskya consettensis TaxID=113560 RepID=A0A919VRI8_9ACTN|nr:SDR family oxidoreductase [Actinoplanes consettensis]GIM73197.1 3-oxoacyl-ACP reductase [Actinoplanes consettensis]